MAAVTDGLRSALVRVCRAMPDDDDEDEDKGRAEQSREVSDPWFYALPSPPLPGPSLFSGEEETRTKPLAICAPSENERGPLKSGKDRVTIHPQPQVTARQ